MLWSFIFFSKSLSCQYNMFFNVYLGLECIPLVENFAELNLINV